MCQIPKTVTDEHGDTPTSSRGAPDEDIDDARRVVAGDTDAFGGIVRRWQGRLVSLAWGFCRDRTLAEDMAQDAFVKAFRALQTFRGESAFSTWLTAIAMNSYRTWLKNRPHAHASIDLVRPIGGGTDPSAAFDDQQRASAVRQLVHTLPRRYRETLVLYYFEEMNLSETARVLELPEGTVKARLHRGRDLLRRRWTALTARRAEGVEKTQDG